MSYLEKTQTHYNDLTKGLKKVGESLLSNPVLFATHPAKKVAEIIDVSETMVIRFCKAIGFNGYGELQKDVQQRLLSIQPSNQEIPIEKSNSFEQVMSIDEINIHQTSRNMDWDTAQEIVNQLVISNAISVVGYYHSFSYAHWFSFLLNNLLENTTLYRPETDIGITKKGKKNCVVIFSYYRYALEAIRLAQEARANGNTIIVITDSQLSPLAEYGDYILTIHSAKKSILEKGPVTFSVLNTLLLHIAQKVGKMEFVNPTNKYYIQ
ncbi:DNA-binding MurR/RpiR family transcriptional regulator [Bacillus pakistanensis]|uniref:DNA-binding MurR/RpiR family transcriptional regulator n=1 Tax=Rossellomorea pakistanensis TaxID=992288 RepID=A0ABS2NH62_9BACI|nr:MurR/RpiR family transcriptional regulator [Bacillus pakistanensis]MBM7587207.1 DNA-binding MurR/RpiR family transcriptional regulator [Bacillus pakistanensis]